MSESYERWYTTRKGETQGLNDLIKMKDHIVISNPSQRKGKGGRPALIVNNTKYNVQNLTQSEITSESSIRKIVVGSLYCKPGSRKKTALIDHISEVYQILGKKYKKGLHWIISGDFNELNDRKILEISPSLKQVVTEPTRLNPPAILDKIITTLHTFLSSSRNLTPPGLRSRQKWKT